MPQPELTTEFERNILEEAVHSPSVAMIRLSIEVDRQLRLILAATGQLKDYIGQPTQALDLIARAMDEQSIFPQALRGTVENFWGLRNLVIHEEPNHHLSIRAVDYGLRILKMLQSIPRRSYIVVYSGMSLYSDQEGNHLRPDVRGVMLKSVGPTGTIEGERVHPTRKEYLAGQSVSWEWNLRGPGWDETWYASMPIGTIQYAWSRSLEFIGRPLEEI